MGEMIKETEQSTRIKMATDQVNGTTCTPSHSCGYELGIKIFGVRSAFGGRDI